MKFAFAAAVLLLAVQQQTFYSASAKPKMPPRPTPQALPAGYIYTGGARHQRPRPKPSSMPHPAPRHT